MDLQGICAVESFHGIIQFFIFFRHLNKSPKLFANGLHSQINAARELISYFFRIPLRIGVLN